MAVRVRFAPSPTGHLHVGNARTALFNWLFARQQGGVFILRVEDTDAERSEAGFEQQLLADLRWLGLDWNEGPDVGGPRGPYRQSGRVALYREHAGRLVAGGAAYPCFCTEEEIEADRQKALAEGRQPMYSGRCRSIPPDEARARLERGQPASIRLKIPPRPIRFRDLVHGEVEFSHEVIGDPILLRSDGTAAYNFAVVVDDTLMGVTHVIRGDDHLSNTPRQVAVYEALGWELPQFAHLSTILGTDHTRLSKRHGATSVAHYREMGVLPEALVNYLALLGWSPADDREIFSLPELVKAFRLENVTKSPAVFNPEKLYWLNRHYLKQADLEGVLALAIEVFQREGLVGEQVDEATRAWLKSVVQTVLPSLDHLSQLPARTDLIFEYDARAALAFQPNREVLSAPGATEVLTSFLKHALAAAQASVARPPQAGGPPAAAGPSAGETPALHDGRQDAGATGDGELSFERFRQIMDAVKQETKQKGRHLFHPVRVAITGYPSGPELDKLIPLLEAGSRLPLPRRVKSPRERLEEFAREFHP